MKQQTHVVFISAIFSLFLVIFTIFAIAAQPACLTGADDPAINAIADCNGIVNLTELLDYIDLWYACSSCHPDIFQSLQAYFFIPFCGDHECNATIGENCSTCPTDCGACPIDFCTNITACSNYTISNCTSPDPCSISMTGCQWNATLAICGPIPPITTGCGNGTRDFNETCDTADLGNATCITLGYDAGMPGCCPECQQFNTTGCSNTTYTSCTDNDAGADYYTASTTDYSFDSVYGPPCNGTGEPQRPPGSGSGSSSDSCSGTVLTEMTCTASQPTTSTYDCASEGMTCQAGACAAGAIELTECISIDTPNRRYVMNQDIDQPLNDSCVIIRAENVTLDCQGHSITSSSTANIGGVYSERPNTEIRNCVIEGFVNGWGIYLENSDDSMVVNNTLIDVMYGFEARDAANNTIANNTFDSNELGVFLRISAYDNIVENNAFIENYRIPGTAGTNGAGVYILEGAIGTIIRNNRFYGGNWHAISISRGAFAPQVDAYAIAVDNEIDDNRGHAIYVTTNKNLVRGNKITNATSGVTLTSGASENMIEHNTLLANRGSGFVVLVNSSDNVFQYNYVNGGPSGFLFDAGADNNTIHDNYVVNSTEYGIAIYQFSGNVTIINNTVHSSANYGFYSNRPASGSLIQDNDFCFNPAGIHCAADQTFIGNRCDSGTVCGGTCTPC